MPLLADGGAPVNLFTQGTVAGHAGPPQAGPAGAGLSLTLLQGQLIIAKALSVTVLLLPAVVLLRDSQAHVYPLVPISETILSVTLDPFSFVLFIYCVLALESRLDTQHKPSRMGSLHLSLPGWMLEPLERCARVAMEWFPVSLIPPMLDATNAALHKGWKDDRDAIVIGSRQASQPSYQVAIQSQAGQGTLFSAPRHFNGDA